MDKKLFMVLLGCKPEGRFTEQHDIFFGIGESLSSLKSDMEQFWKEAQGKLHVDVWRHVSTVDGFSIEVVDKQQENEQLEKLFFVNLGGYRHQDFEEYHYKQLIVANTIEEASKKAKETTFFKNHISPHIDDKYGLDVDDIYQVTEALPASMYQRYNLRLSPASRLFDDKLHVGYLKFSDL
ncbi:DUF1543 domain-containing protein [Sphingobacterium sp. LRF_L2]|uniref:DUF1543 domain-containing protein n=1 Tax=Sphingobacterium sp. LRF_L2 TaxID=3369421 RepID=UPI003F5E136B